LPVRGELDIDMRVILTLFLLSLLLSLAPNTCYTFAVGETSPALAREDMVGCVAGAFRCAGDRRHGVGGAAAVTAAKLGCKASAPRIVDCMPARERGEHRTGDFGDAGGGDADLLAQRIDRIVLYEGVRHAYPAHEVEPAAFARRKLQNRRTETRRQSCCPRQSTPAALSRIRSKSTARREAL